MTVAAEPITTDQPTVVPCTITWQGRLHDGTLTVAPAAAGWYARVEAGFGLAFLTGDGWFQILAGRSVCRFVTVDDALAAIRETGDIQTEAT